MGTKHFLSAALTFVIQERQVTSLCGVSPILHRIKKCSSGAYGAKDKPGDIPLPRSLRRYAPAVRLRRAVRIKKVDNNRKGGKEEKTGKGHGVAVFS